MSGDIRVGPVLLSQQCPMLLHHHFHHPFLADYLFTKITLGRKSQPSPHMSIISQLSAFLLADLQNFQSDIEFVFCFQYFVDALTPIMPVASLDKIDGW